MVGTPVNVADLLPGDLLFYATDPSDLSTVHHVVMYAGSGLVVHAPHTGDVVRLGPMWLGEEFAGAIRVVDAVPTVPVASASATKAHPKRRRLRTGRVLPVARPSRSAAPSKAPSASSSPTNGPTVTPTPIAGDTGSPDRGGAVGGGRFAEPTPTEAAPIVVPDSPTPTE